MLLLLNTTKLMDLEAPVPPRLRPTEARHTAEARTLIAALRGVKTPELQGMMDLSPELADATRADLVRWGESGRASRPALFVFTGLVYKHLDAATFTADDRRRAQRRLRIMSGLYGLLRPLDRIEAYRLEMGCRFAPPGARNMTAFWKDRLTDALNEDLAAGEPVLSTASQEYLKAVDAKRLRGPLITPVFKERRPDGSLRTPTVHAKMARGALIRHAVVHNAKQPEDLMGFSALGWEAAEPPPASGPWLFTRDRRD